MPVRGTITYVGSPEATLAELRRAVKPALQDAVKEWHHKFLRRHFFESATTRYGYKARSAKYEQRKQRRKGHTRPLVWSGDMRRMLLRSITLSGTSKRARGKLMGPKYLYQYHKNRDEVHKADEITAVTTDEVTGLAHLVDKNITARLNAITKTEVKRF